MATIVCRHQNIDLIDFVIESQMTTRDENFLDQIHYRVSVAQEIFRLIADGAFSREKDPQIYRYCSEMVQTVN